MKGNTTTIIATTPDEIANLMQPYFDRMAEKALQMAIEIATKETRLLSYEEARTELGMGKTRFSQAIADNVIPYVLNGNRKRFRKSDLMAFEGYNPKTEAEKQFEAELANRKL